MKNSTQKLVGQAVYLTLRILIWVIPVFGFVVSLAMYPLVLNTTPFRLTIIAMLLLSPIIAVCLPARMRNAWFYAGVLAAQILALAYLNRWF
ncbi:hypothetical protein [Acuticoccus kandeliae]|uniref:hypothetical protein n=1 Tax=Acuticoccus kandeliae TaxID=2073160 RepID=UPI001300B8C5|nr:hypothetical protein [Acuticoccus kandeliae]